MTDNSETEPAGGPRALNHAAYDVPPDRPAVDCDYCGRPFADESLLALHRGLAHSADLTEAEHAAFEATYETETGQLRRFRLKTLAALVFLYFGLLMVYALVI